MSNADGTPTPNEQAAVEQQMRARPEPVDPNQFAALQQRMNELDTQLTAERSKREAAEHAQSEAEARLLAVQSGAVPARATRQIPVWYALTSDHATASGDLKGLIADINSEFDKMPGFQKLDPSSFLALNSEVLDADARARGFDRGARWSSQAEDGSFTTGYHLFAGSLVLVGMRDTTPPKSGNVNATVVTK